MKRCKYIKTNGQDVICILKDKVLGDIMGYSGNECEICTDYSSETQPPINTEEV